MPSIRYINQTAPFWDFIASLENNASQAQNQATQREGEANQAQDHTAQSSNNAGRSGAFGAFNNTEQFGPFGHPNWAGAWASPWNHGPIPHHHGPPHPPHRHHGRNRSRGPRGPHSPPPPPGFEHDNTDNEQGHEKSPDTLMGDNAAPAEGTAREISGDEQFSGPEGCRRRGPGGCRGRGRRGSPHRNHHGPGGRHRHGGPPGGFPFRGPWFMERWNEFLNGNNFMNNTTTNNNESQDFKPDADVFDTESSYVIHLSLAGAKKEDIGVSYDAEKSELTVSGVLHRPGDEEFLKTLALDERKVGVFERKVRLGSRANPAVVDADMITAKLIDGVLIVEVPKTDKDYVEVRKVDIE